MIKSIAIIFLSASAFLFSQDPPVEWEEIPVEDLRMQNYLADTNASALVLCDYGYSRVTDNMELEFTRHTRIKIFNENGYDLATQVVFSNDEYDDVKDIEGYTYWLDENGEIVSSELESDDVMEEKLYDNYSTFKFTMPALKPGCIIEFRYKILNSMVSLVRSWVFQYDEPVRWSEYRFFFPQFLSYSAVYSGLESFYINEALPTTKFYSGIAASYYGNSMVPSYLMRWVVKDAPAVREEPFITCTDDYKNKVDLQLAGWAEHGHGFKKYFFDWEDFVDKYLNIDWFGKRITTSGKVAEISEELTSSLTDPLIKMKSIYKWVSKSIVWSGREVVFTTKSMDDVINDKSGNCAEINLLLVSLLRSAGLESDPLVLSTRDNGKVQHVYPIYHQFNYVIARVKAGDKYYYLDATDPYRPFDLLPEKILNVKAVLIRHGDQTEFITLSTYKKNSDTNLARIEILPDGQIQGYIESAFGEFESLDLRKNFTVFSEKEIVHDIYKTELLGLQIDSFEVTGKDELEKPVRIKVNFTSDTYAQTNTDYFYLNPHLIRFRENPLKTENRKLPVDFNYQQGFTSVVNIMVPDGWQVQENIKSCFITCNGTNNSYNQKVMVEGTQIQITCKFFIKDTEVKPAFYNDLREFYSQILKSQSEQIVLKKQVAAGKSSP